MKSTKKSKPNVSAIFDKIEFVGFTKEQKRVVKKKIKESIVND
tara:strand:- start:2795 stop:2923 length:129 start_codon:yes stop_codon:yes gene_type:complete